MKNKTAGYMILIVVGLLGFITFSFNRALTDIVNTSCSHGASCPMWGSIKFQTNVSIAIIIAVALIGVYLIFSGEDEKLIKEIEQKILPKISKKIKTVKEVKPKKITKEQYSEVIKNLEKDEKLIFKNLIESQGSILQSELVKKTSLSKVRITRILDKLEGKSLIERRRRGMTNIVILK